MSSTILPPCPPPDAPADTFTVDYYLDGDTLVIASTTIPGRLHVVTATECTCDAGRDAWPCQHADYRLHILASHARIHGS